MPGVVVTGFPCDGLVLEWYGNSEATSVHTIPMAGSVQHIIRHPCKSGSCEVAIRHGQSTDFSLVSGCDSLQKHAVSEKEGYEQGASVVLAANVKRRLLECSPLVELVPEL